MNITFKRIDILKITYVNKKINAIKVYEKK